jgi:VanZ family protein
LILLGKKIGMVKWKIGLGIYCVLVLYISSMSPGELPKTEVQVSDKAIHLVEYAIMGILAWGAFSKGGAGFPWGLLAFCACFGIADECWQDWLGSGRSPEVWDAAADAAGAFIGLLLSMVFWKR